MVKSDKIIFSGLGCAAILFWVFYTPKVTYGYGQVAPNEPVQTTIEPMKSQPIAFGDNYTLYPLATYEIEARVLAKENYYLDAGSNLAPIDLGVGWGVMSDEILLEKISFSQGFRFLNWKFKDRSVNYSEVNSHASNMHIIPATNDVKSEVRSLHVGEVVKLSGKLVAVDGANGWRWRSSLTRTDSGAGACELMYVEKVEVKAI